MSTTDMLALERLVALQHKAQLEYILELENTILAMAQTALDIEVPTGENEDAVRFVLARSKNTSVVQDAKEFLAELEASNCY